MKKNHSFPIVVEGDDDGYFVFCPILQGCYSCAPTYEQALENIRDAIRLNVADIHATKGVLKMPKTLALTSLEVAV
jgi:predicted RNase H-like HicB family nuclease